MLATKSVFRFGDLKKSKDRKLTEYILIGTLLSFGIAAAIGMIYTSLIKSDTIDTIPILQNFFSSAKEHVY